MKTDASTMATAEPTRARRATATTAAAPTASATPPAPKPTTKSDTVIKLLLRGKGATPTELIAATDWQPHSLRAFLSGLRKKGRAIVREARKSGEFAYRIVAASGGETAATLAFATMPDNLTDQDSAAATVTTGDGA